MKVLILEKYTSYEFVHKKRNIKSIPNNRLLSLKKSHGEHIKVRTEFLQLLDKNNIDYSIMKETLLSRVHCSKYQFVISLGGDGTFLHAASIVNEDIPIIGINTDITKSHGFLTKFCYKDLDKIVNIILTNKFKSENWNRLCAFINNRKLEHLALNEILIGNEKIYTTSHLNVKIGDKQGDFIGNGIVISTKKGSTAFYKSSGGVPFSVNSLAYSIILPFKKRGNLESSCVLEVNKSIIVKPKRSGYKLLFDCDEKRSYKLRQEDKIEVKIDESDGLDVVI